MMQTKTWWFVPVIAGALVSCANEKTDSARPAPPKSFSQRLNEDNGFKQTETGDWVPRSDKRSQFELVGESPYFRGERKEKEYQTGEYKRSSWWGKKDYRTSAWQGSGEAEQFQKPARQQGKTARESGSAARMTGAYRTGRFATEPAREAGRGGIDTGLDAETQLARESYQAPDVVEWGEKRNLSRDETRSLLGR